MPDGGGACLCGLGVKQMKSRNLILLTSNDFNNCSIVLLPILLDEGLCVSIRCLLDSIAAAS